MVYKNKDHIQLEQLQVPDTLDKFIENLPSRYSNGEISNDVEKQMESDWKEFHRGTKQRVFGKRVAQAFLGLAAGFLLFIGAAFVSPAVAQVASQIPILNLMFEYKSLLSQVQDEIKSEGFNYQNIIVSVSHKDKELTVMVWETKETYEQIKPQLDELIQDILSKRNEDYKVTFLNDPEAAKMIQEQLAKGPDDEMNKVFDAIYEVLGKYGYGKGGIGVREGLIELSNIPNTETRMDEIKADIIEALNQKKLGTYDVKIYAYDPQLREREGKFMQIYNIMADGLMEKQSYHVDNVGFSNTKYKEYFYIKISTTLKASDPNMRETVQTLETAVKDFLQSEEVITKIQDEKYRVVIASVDNKEMKVIQN